MPYEYNITFKHGNKALREFRTFQCYEISSHVTFLSLRVVTSLFVLFIDSCRRHDSINTCLYFDILFSRYYLLKLQFATNTLNTVSKQRNKNKSFCPFIAIHREKYEYVSCVKFKSSLISRIRLDWLPSLGIYYMLFTILHSRGISLVHCRFPRVRTEAARNLI